MIEHHNTIVVIPARMASTRLPGKPLADIHGLPMIVHVWRRAMEAKVGQVLVAAAENEIAEVVKAHGGDAIVTDPNLPSGSDRVAAALRMRDPRGKYEFVLNLQGDLPTLEPRLVTDCLAPLRAKGPHIATIAAEIRNEADKTELRRFLNLAGYYGRRTPAIYQLVRILAALGLGLISAAGYGKLFPNHPFWVVTGASMLLAALGYYLPRSMVSLRRDKLCEEHRQGFPDFLDLLVICVEAGIGVDSAIERVGKDLTRSFPSLAQNLRFMSLELRAGRSTRGALDNLSQRLGIEEARSFATLIQQSEELGSSLVQSLRVYAEEMRAKRLARAEEKAHGLPAKLVIPLGLFIFPVILGVTMMPVALKVFKALGI